MPTELQQRTRPRSSEESELTFSPDELAALLKKASSSPQTTTQRPLSLADAIQTARELGIPEENVLAAAEELKREKVQRATKGIRIRRRRDAFIRFLFTMLAISCGIGLMSGIKAGVAIAFAMSIPLFILGSRWALAFLDVRDEEGVEMERVLRRRDRKRSRQERD